MFTVIVHQNTNHVPILESCIEIKELSIKKNTEQIIQKARLSFEMSETNGQFLFYWF